MQTRQRLEPSLVITGSVVREDGTPPPAGVVIERVCHGRTIKETYADAHGGFSFYIGGKSDVLPDASDDASALQGTTLNISLPRSAVPLGSATGTSIELMGCELRAQFPGHRSSTVSLGGLQRTGQVDVGTIVIHPIAKVPGTTVSVTSMQAPGGARKALERAEKAIQRNSLDEADRHFQEAVAAYPGYAQAWFGLGLIRQHQNRISDARQAYGRALEADSHFVRPRIELARIAGHERRWEEVADITDRALALNPLDFPEGFFMNALANYHLERLEASERSARRAVRIDSAHRYPQAHLLLAFILRHRKDAAGEAEQLRSYLKYAPANADTAEQRSRLAHLESKGSIVAGNLPDRR
ncbi:MAG: tetratricopeptide repeat protein [Acidobacteria bacterium]|nr:tetratricopeptide repeat protein [Acidobacteriota bacterium]